MSHKRRQPIEDLDSKESRNDEQFDDDEEIIIDPDEINNPHYYESDEEFEEDSDIELSSVANLIKDLRPPITQTQESEDTLHHGKYTVLVYLISKKVRLP
jgi:hypothetical protein